MSGLKKIALEVIPGMAPIGDVKDQGVSRQRARPSSSTGAPVSSQNSARPTKEEQEQVMRMQQIMAELGRAIDRNTEAFAAKTKISPQEAAVLSGAIRNTGQGTSTPFDGKWGPKTIDALKKINESAFDTDGEAIVRVNPGKHYKQVAPKQVIEAAQQNIDSIAKLMSVVGFGESIPNSVNVRPERYDVIPQKLNPGTIRNTPDGDGIAVRPAHLDNIRNFYNFLKSNIYNMSSSAAYDGEDRLEKIADHIVDSTIIRLAQQAPVATPADQASGAGAERERVYRTQDKIQAQRDAEFERRLNEAMQKQEGKPEGITVQMLDQAIKWFEARANAMYQQVEDWYTSKAQSIDDGEYKPLATQKDLKNAKEYFKSVNNLRKNWEAQRRKFLKGNQNPAQASVNPKDFVHFQDVDAALRAQRDMYGDREVGVSRERGGSGESQTTSRKDNDSASSTRKVDLEESESVQFEGFELLHKFRKEGPLDYVLRLDTLLEYIPSNVDHEKQWLIKNMSFLEVSMRQIRQMSPRDIVMTYRGNPDKNARAFAVNMPYAIRKILISIFDNWRTQVLDMVSNLPNTEGASDTKSYYMRLVDKQRNILGSWVNILNEKQVAGQNWTVGAVMKNPSLR